MKRFSLVLPLLLGIGCITFVGGFVWKKRTHTTTLAFADDDTQVLGAHTAHEVTVNAAPPVIPGRSRKHEYQLFLQNPEETERQKLGKLRQGRLDGVAYLMRNAGYALVQENTESNHRYVQINLNDNSTRVVYEVPWYDRSLPFIRLIPSPDGKILARCRLTDRSLPKESGRTIPRTIAEVEITFIDAFTLKETKRTTTILFSDAASTLDAAWLPDNTLRLTNFVNKEARVVTLDGKTKPIPCPEHIRAATTTSSSYDGKGRYLFGLNPDGSLHLGTPMPEEAFGMD
jgi:hypothetical protein